MSDRIVLTVPDGSFGRMFCAEGEIYGPLPPAASAHRAIYDRLKAAGAQIVPYVSPAPPTPSVTGNQWVFALKDLSLADAWQGAVARSKTSDQIRIGLIARDTPLLAADPLLARVAANAGTDAAGAAVIDPARVFAQALTEST